MRMAEKRPLTADTAMNSDKGISNPYPIHKQSVNGRKKALTHESLNLCQVCRQNVKGKRKGKKFCSDRCRLLFWAASTLVKEYKAGNVNGLRDLIKELCE